MNKRPLTIKKEASVSVEDVRHALAYDARSGSFTWRVSPANCAPVGTIAGCRRRTGYVIIKFRGYQFAAHRLAWLYMTGRWPDAQIDHINGVRDDNRFCNLRSVDQTGNMQNKPRAQRNNMLGVRGVCLHRGRYRAQVCVAGRRAHCSEHETLDEAKSAYAVAKRKFHIAQP